MSARDLKLGRRPPANKPALQLAHFLTGVVPAHPASVDYLAALNGGWQMLGNDQYGDCVPVTMANLTRLITATIGAGEVYPDLNQVLAWYKTQNPGFPAEDNGMVIQTFLEYLVKTGLIVGFAQVDVKNLAEVQAAIDLFGHIWTGITVLEANETEFDNGQPWDFVAGSSEAGGHSVLVGGYFSAQPGDDNRFITWATETGFTDAFWAKLVEEGWVVIFKEHLGSKVFQAGVDVAGLAAAFTQITGQPFPAPVPTPVPVPPAPVPPTPPAPTPPTPPAPTPPAPPPPLPPDLEERILRAVEKAIRAVLHGIFDRPAD
ncbi:MAG TPA: hypothetical protein VKR24_07955 [Candidatus Limnocylindrales bacterium]|nr:hypothetical protein [Candidatus Limnocylindrales bacterium]